MANIYRVQKNSNYVVMNKTSLMDERLSWKAKGLHAYMLSLPDDWKFYDTELQKHAKDGRDALKSALKELRDLGYLKRVQHRNEDGTFNYETLVFEVPQMDPPLPGKPLPGKPLTDYPLTENPKLLSNNELSIDELNNNGLSNKAAAVKKLLNKFIELRHHGFVATPKDEAAAAKIIEFGVDVDDAIRWMEEKFASHQPKHPKDYIKSLDYCSGYIFDRFVEKQEANRGEGNGAKIPKYRRSYGRPAGKSAEQAIREAEEARRAWGG
ncbi:hypothetical protein [Heyndrickxia coagulans]|uniref:Uncharacterized protein n=1 Tax=Heyndrickxia coagulans TaxID=1398 RepID=A0A150KHF3_HEYCO|nr:hypothetical protein [Heyndrickxia coagulans]KYC72316.1 hypothetical protein B4099_3678 [Heyndrickxia coagulans]